MKHEAKYVSIFWLINYVLPVSESSGCFKVGYGGMGKPFERLYDVTTAKLGCGGQRTDL